MELTNKKILVTGSEGFIGSHLTEELIRRGLRVKSFVQYNSFNTWGWLDTLPPSIRKELDIFSGDVRDPFGVKEAMKGCDVVLHLAALIAIPYSYHSPAAYIETNVTGTLNVVQAARELEIEKVVHTSTSEVYGTARYVPMDEQHALRGQSPYSASKIGADQIAMSFYYSFQTPVAIIRPFNTYGPRQSLRAVIPSIITQIAQGFETIKIGATNPTRDFSYVKDTVSGFIKIAESDLSLGEVINIGSNYEISIAETAQVILDTMGREVRLEQENIRLRPSKSEVDRLWADNKKAWALLGWKPEYGGIEGFKRGIKETVEWFSREDNLKKYKVERYNL